MQRATLLLCFCFIYKTLVRLSTLLFRATRNLTLKEDTRTNQTYCIISIRIIKRIMAKRARSICLFGTSANPPTGKEGHVGIVEALSAMRKEHSSNNRRERGEPEESRLMFDEIRVVPVYSHPFPAKRALLAPFEHRVQMCQLAFQDVPNTELSKAEETIHHVKEQKQQKEQTSNNNEGGEPRRGISVGTADLLEYYRSQDKSTTEAEHLTHTYTLCLGMDTFLDLMSGQWRRTQDILDLVQGRFVVLYRKEEEQDKDDDDDTKPMDRVLEKPEAVNTSNEHSQQSDSKQQVLEEAIRKLEDAYGKSCCQLLHVPTLGAVSSTLARSLSSTLSTKSMEQDALMDSAINDASVVSQDLQRLEERMKRLVSSRVFDYMQKHKLYGVDS